jgi:hypothetical protein
LDRFTITHIVARLGPNFTAVTPEKNLIDQRELSLITWSMRPTLGLAASQDCAVSLAFNVTSRWRQQLDCSCTVKKAINGQFKIEKIIASRMSSNHTTAYRSSERQSVEALGNQDGTSKKLPS